MSSVNEQSWKNVFISQSKFNCDEASVWKSETENEMIENM